MHCETSCQVDYWTTMIALSVLDFKVTERSEKSRSEKWVPLTENPGDGAG